jgi:hypothetical protein
MFTSWVNSFFEEITINKQFSWMLELVLFPQVDELLNADNVYLQLNGAPPHFSNLLQYALNKKFPNKWISRNGLIS